MDRPIPQQRQRRYSENLFDPEPTFRLARRPVLPQRHRGLPPEAPLPAGADLGRLQELMREFAPAGWSTDGAALDRALDGLRAWPAHDMREGGAHMEQETEQTTPESTDTDVEETETEETETAE